MSPVTIPVTMEAAPNIPATEAYSGSTDLYGNQWDCVSVLVEVKTLWLQKFPPC
jgi:hypothetical protein